MALCVDHVGFCMKMQITLAVVEVSQDEVRAVRYNTRPHAMLIPARKRSGVVLPA